MSKWSEKEVMEHFRANVKDYNSMVVVGALYKIAYGDFPKFGMSGQQAEYADFLISKLPNKDKR